MFYNSLIVNAIIKIFQKLNQLYENSFIHKIFFAIANLFKMLSRGSVIINSFKSKESILKNSVLYKFTKNFVELLNIIIEKILGLVVLSGKSSIIMNMANNTGGTLEKGLNSIGGALILLSAVLKYTNSNLFIPALILGLVILFLSFNIRAAIETSMTKKLILKLWEIYLPDKEVENGEV